jgi:arylsulfatase A
MIIGSSSETAKGYYRTFKIMHRAFRGDGLDYNHGRDASRLGLLKNLSMNNHGEIVNLRPIRYRRRYDVNRCRMIPTIGYFLLVCVPSLLYETKINAATSPNIVILYADDMGYGDLNLQNPQSKIPTPHLDRLASEGTRFTDGHSSSGICTPSRYALLEGRYHWRKFHGIVNSFDQPVLDDEKTTMAEMLKSKGYRTACIGKWHLGWDWNAIKKSGAEPKGKKEVFSPNAFDWTKPIAGGPLSHGFDYYYGDDVPNFPPYAWFENDRVITTPTVTLTTTAPTAEGSWEARPGPAVEAWDFWNVMPTLTTKAEKWIAEQSKDQPFFLYFPFTSPHAPIVPTKEFVGKSQAGGFGDFVVQTDDTVGRMLAALEKHGFAENTLVIFSADNGPERYAYDRIQNFNHRSMGPLRGLKRDIWEGGHRVPFVVRWPGVVPAGKVSDGLISQIDLFATVAEVVGAAIPPGSAEDSYNQLPLLKGSGPSARDTLVHNTNPNGYALRHGDWVLINAKTGAVSAVPPWFDEANGYEKNSRPGELYNLKDDLAQRTNLFDKHPDKVAELKAALDKLVGEGRSAISDKR